MQDWPKAPVPRSLTTWTLRRVVVWSIYDQRIYQFHTRTCSRLMQFAGYINLNHVSSRIWIVFQVITTNNIAASLFIVFHQWSICWRSLVRHVVQGRRTDPKSICSIMVSTSRGIMTWVYLSVSNLLLCNPWPSGGCWIEIACRLLQRAPAFVAETLLRTRYALLSNFSIEQPVLAF